MQKLQFNRIFFLFTFLVVHHAAIYTMQNNKQLNSTKNFPQQKNHTGGKIIKETRGQDLINRLKNRFLTELPKPIEKIKPTPKPFVPALDTNIVSCNYNYPMHHDFDLPWTEK